MNPVSSMEQQFMTNILNIVEKNLHDENFGVNELATELGISRTTLHRKVKTIIKKSVSEFIRETRLKRAHELLQKRAGTVSEIAFNVGFSSVSYFNRCFKKQFGYTPGDVQKGLIPVSTDSEKGSNKKSKLKSKRNLWLAASVIVMAAVAITLIWTVNLDSKAVHKTLAVFPLQLNNAEKEFENEMQWISLDLINTLNKISEISVVPYSSIKHYDFVDKTNHQIAKELMVDFIFSWQCKKLDRQTKIYMELVDVSADTSWSEVVTEISDLEHSLTFGEDVAIRVAGALNINLTSRQGNATKNSLTNSQDALSFYLQANDILAAPYREMDGILNAKKLLGNAIELDTTFSEAYSALGKIYSGILRYTPNVYLAENYLDSSVIFSKKALLYDNNNQEAIKALFNFYTEKGMSEQAREMEVRLSDKPIKNYLYYQEDFGKYTMQGDHYNQLLSYYRFLELKPEDVVVPGWMNQNLYDACNEMGFPEQALKYSNKWFINKFKKTEAPQDYSHSLFIDEFNGKYESGYQRALRITEKNKYEPVSCFYIPRYLERTGNYQEACKHLDKLETMEGPWGENWLEMLSNKSRLIYPFGYCYLKTGQTEKANFYFNRFIKKYNDEIKLNAYYARNYYTFMEISMVHAAMGNKDETIKHLERIRNMKACPLWFILTMKNSPWFENIRDTSEFKKLLAEFETSYQKEHKRIANLIQEYDTIDS